MRHRARLLSITDFRTGRCDPDRLNPGTPQREVETMLNRRHFMRLGGLSMLLAYSGVLAGAFRAVGFTRDSFRREAFGLLLNTNFVANSDEKSMMMQLVEITEQAYENELDQYQLLFESTQADLPEGIYQVGHESIRSMQGYMYLMPSKLERPGIYYRAIFCQFA
ncbi:MAG: hypothetical protein OEQ74_06325 [Gammaproteobacteria bacterium]|nr:hypothetical protein [Gammaproteobacteria bacterium]